MFVPICNKDIVFFEKKLVSSLGARQENNVKFKFAIHSQGVLQIHDNCQIAKLLYIVYLNIIVIQYICHK